MKHTLETLVVILVTAAPVAAFAGATAPQPGSDPWQVDMGFLGGRRQYTGAGFTPGSGAPAGAAGLVAPFGAAPYTGVTVLGVGYDLRLVVSHVRMTLGFDLPFSRFDPAASAGTYTVNGKQTPVVPQALHGLAVRVGLGGEVPEGRFVPYADLEGTVAWTRTDLALGTRPARFYAFDFGLSVDAGIRCYLGPHMFVVASGAAGIFSDQVWTARVGVGASFGD